jgi:hypothetical protein
MMRCDGLPFSSCAAPQGYIGNENPGGLVSNCIPMRKQCIRSNRSTWWRTFPMMYHSVNISRGFDERLWQMMANDCSHQTPYIDGQMLDKCFVWFDYVAVMMVQWGNLMERGLWVFAGVSTAKWETCVGNVRVHQPKPRCPVWWANG